MARMRSLFVIATLLSLSIPGAASADQPLESPDAFEAAVTRCLLTNAAPSSCFDAHLRGHFPPGNEKLNEVVGQLRGLFEKWLGKDKVFAFHSVKRLTLGTYAERRVYLVEDSSGAIMMLDTTFSRMVGKWYLRKFNLSSTKDEIKSVLGDVL